MVFITSYTFPSLSLISAAGNSIQLLSTTSDMNLICNGAGPSTRNEGVTMALQFPHDEVSASQLNILEKTCFVGLKNELNKFIATNNTSNTPVNLNSGFHAG